MAHPKEQARPPKLSKRLSMPFYLSPGRAPENRKKADEVLSAFQNLGSSSSMTKQTSTTPDNNLQHRLPDRSSTPVSSMKSSSKSIRFLRRVRSLFIRAKDVDLEVTQQSEALAIRPPTSENSSAADLSSFSHADLTSAVDSALNDVLADDTCRSYQTPNDSNTNSTFEPNATTSLAKPIPTTVHNTQVSQPSPQSTNLQPSKTFSASSSTHSANNTSSTLTPTSEHPSTSSQPMLELPHINIESSTDWSLLAKRQATETSDDDLSDAASESSIEIMDFPLDSRPAIGQIFSRPPTDTLRPLTLPRSFGRRKSVGFANEVETFHAPVLMQSSNSVDSNNTYSKSLGRPPTDTKISEYHMWMASSASWSNDRWSSNTSVKRSKSFAERSIVITPENIDDIVNDDDDSQPLTSTIAGPASSTSTSAADGSSKSIDSTPGHSPFPKSRHLSLGRKPFSDRLDVSAIMKEDIALSHMDSPLSPQSTKSKEGDSLDLTRSASLKRSNSVKSQFNDIADGISPDTSAGPVLPPSAYLDLIEAMYDPPQNYMPPPITRTEMAGSTALLPKAEWNTTDSVRNQEQLDVITLYSTPLATREVKKSSSLGRTVQTANQYDSESEATDDDGSSIVSVASTKSEQIPPPPAAVPSSAEPELKKNLRKSSSMGSLNWIKAMKPSDKKMRKSEKSEVLKNSKKKQHPPKWLSKLLQLKAAVSTIDVENTMMAEEIETSRSQPTASSDPAEITEATVAENDIISPAAELNDEDNIANINYPSFAEGYPRFSLSVEKSVYKLSHVKLAEHHRPLLQQVAISNLMLYIISVHADVTLKRRGPHGRKKKKKKSKGNLRRKKELAGEVPIPVFSPSSLLSPYVAREADSAMVETPLVTLNANGTTTESQKPPSPPRRSPTKPLLSFEEDLTRRLSDPQIPSDSLESGGETDTATTESDYASDSSITKSLAQFTKKFKTKRKKGKEAGLDVLRDSKMQNEIEGGEGEGNVKEGLGKVDEDDETPLGLLRNVRFTLEPAELTKTIAGEMSPTFSILVCLLISFLFVAILYLPHPPGIPPKAHRNDPRVIKLRMKRIGIICVISPLIVALTLRSNYPDLLIHLGIRLDTLIPSATLSLLLTALLFLGPLVTEFFDKTLGPLAEELVFRGCMVPLFFSARIGLTTTVFCLPLLFGMAHLHHGYQTYVQGGRTTKALGQAILTSSVQLLYTSIFGWLSTFLFLRTGNIAGPLASHMFCNSMGVPDFSVFAGPYSGRNCIVLFGLSLFPMTDPRYFASPFWTM
ncbi:CAAX prenyl protease [Chytridiales sp. JEL 0842]|nr:CAAX prenyl protease [Chytridiales sp. JEL 0842]